ncbi:hypothetical protein ACT7DE_20155 [Bacillus paranthracis]
MAIVRQGEVLEVGKKISGNFKDGFKFNNGIANKHIIDPDVWSMNIRDVEILTEEKSRSKKCGRKSYCRGSSAGRSRGCCRWSDGEK